MCVSFLSHSLSLSLTRLLSVSRSGGWFWENDGGGDADDDVDGVVVCRLWFCVLSVHLLAKKNEEYYSLFPFLAHWLRVLNNIENTNPDKTLKLMCIFLFALFCRVR